MVPLILLTTGGGCSSAAPDDGLTGLRRAGDVPSAVASSGSRSAETTSSAPPRPGQPAVEPLPLQHYMLVGRDYDTVRQALAELAAQCMADQGFDMEARQPPPARGMLIDITFRRYGAPETLEDAKEAGYGVPARAEGGSDEDLDEPLSDAALAAYMGSEDEMHEAWKKRRRAGCVGEADRQLMGDASVIEASGLAQAQLVQDVNIDPRSTDSPETREATREFSGCMARAGYPGLEDPFDVPAQFEAGDESGRPSDAEKQAAVTQFGCFEESGVREAMRAAEVAFQTKAIEANPEAFAQIRRELDDVVRRATTVVAEGSGQ
ncbi:MAG: hypothetical protein QM713_02910 [Arachnia sp.]